MNSAPLDDTLGEQAPRANLWRWIGHICALGVGGMFLYASVEKIIEPRQFVIDVNNYHIIPRKFANLFALILPWLELFSAIVLMIPKTRPAGGILISGMLVMFMIAVAVATHKGYDIHCGCFGKASGAVSMKTIAFDAGLLLATIISVITLRRPATIPPPVPAWN